MIRLRYYRATILSLIYFFGAYTASFAQQAVTIDEAIRQVSGYFTGILPHGSSVAILNIESSNFNISDHVIEELSAQLVNCQLFVIVDRHKLEMIRQEEQFQLSGEVSDETAQRVGQKIGAQIIISGSFVHIGNQYRLRIKAITVETAQIQGQILPISVKMDKVLKGLEQEADESGNKDFHNALHDKNRLYLGARGGLALGFYDNGGGLADRTLYPSQTINGNPSYNVSLYIAAPIWGLLAMQAEALITKDTFELFSGNASIRTVSYNSLMIPVLAKLVYRPSIFTVQGFAGAYWSPSLGQMEVKHGNGSYATKFSSFVFGFTAGGGLGIKLGPGNVMADIRYAGDFNNVTTNSENKNISRRNKLLFALGYEIGLMPK